MKPISIFALAFAISLAAGCRQNDVRTVTIEIPGLTHSNTGKVASALMRYRGVADYAKGDGLRWDLERKTLTVRYDAMQVAHTNLRMAIQDAGVEVAFPPNSPVAGYIDGIVK